MLLQALRSASGAATNLINTPGCLNAYLMNHVPGMPEWLRRMGSSSTPRPCPVWAHLRDMRSAAAHYCSVLWPGFRAPVPQDGLQRHLPHSAPAALRCAQISALSAKDRLKGLHMASRRSILLFCMVTLCHLGGHSVGVSVAEAAVPVQGLSIAS